MASLQDMIVDYVVFGFWACSSITASVIGLFVLKCLYNLSPLHPLYKYPGPRLWRATRLAASTHHARGDLYKEIAAIHAQYGPTVRVAPDELSFTSPEAWSQIFNSRPQLAKTKYHFGSSGKDTRIPESMITAPDAEHMRLRRLTNPAFLNSGINEVEPVLQHYTNKLITQLEKASSSAASGGSQNMVEWFLWVLNDVIGQLALDQEFECLEKQRLHPWPSFLMKILKQTAFFNQLKRFGFPLELLGPFLPKRVLEERDNFYNLAEESIKQRLKRESDPEAHVIEKKSVNLNRPDIIGLMLRELKGDTLSEPEIISNSVLIVGGGAETTSSCLSSMLYHLCKTPRVMQKLRDELRAKFESLDDITIKGCADMPYLKATIDESLRIFSVASFIAPRMVPKGGHMVDGERIPAGTYVGMGQWFMGRSDRFFENPLEFKPERWLDARRAGGPEGFAVDEVLRPFSLGPRNCIGKLLAVAEARLVIAKLLWNFDVELDGPHDDWVEDARFYILWELQPLMVKLTPAIRS